MPDRTARKTAQESNQVVLDRFQQETSNVLVRHFDCKRSCKVFYYVCKSDIDDAGCDPSAFDKLRKSVKIIKLLKPFGRSKNEYARDELKLLKGLTPYCHPNLVQLIDFDERLHNWIQMNHVGPNLKIIDSFGSTLPDEFVWHIFRDVSAGLAFLHWGISTGWIKGDTVPESWIPIAHGNMGASSILLDMNHRSAMGYPRAVLSDFSQGEKYTVPSRGNRTNAADWYPAKKDVSQAAVAIHKLAHPFPFEAEPDEGGSSCTCLTSRPCPQWFDRNTMDKELTGVLELAYTTGKDQLTSKALLEHIDGEQLHSKKFPDVVEALQPEDVSLLTSQLLKNSEIRSAIPQLQGVYTDDDDEAQVNAELLEDQLAFVDDDVEMVETEHGPVDDDVEMAETGHTFVYDDDAEIVETGHASFIAHAPAQIDESNIDPRLLADAPETIPTNAETWEISSTSTLSDPPDDLEEE